MKTPISIRPTRVLMVALSVVSLTGCVSPLDRAAEQELHDRLIASSRAHLASVAAGPVVELTRPPSDVESELSEQRRIDLDAISGPGAYSHQPLTLGDDLMGQPNTRTVTMSLQQAIHTAAQHNLDVRLARMQPAVTQTQITQAESVFDATFFTNANFQNLDTPRPPVPGALSVFGSQQSQNTQLVTGIRKTLGSGGQIVAQTEFSHVDDDPSFFATPPGTGANFYNTNVLVSLSQPLLRNFGSDVNRAQIVLASNARRESLQDLRGQILATVFNTEAAYWNLVFARQQLLIQLRLLQRTIDDRDQLKQREHFDVNPVRLTEANSFVELRRGDVIRARQQVRLASDALKRLINDPDLPIAGETLIVPLDPPADLPVSFSILDAVTTALRHRPELKRSLLEINDASVRQRVADNQRLPLLNLAATVRYNGVGDDLDGSYDALGDGDFIDYLLSAQFEVPIGNRGPEAAYRQQQLARRAAVINYQRLAQNAVLELKDALRDLHTTYQLIGSTRAARRAAADNLRAIEEQEAAGVALTPEFLMDLKLTTQQRLADTEVQEVRATTDYNIAIARFYQTLGTLLERNNIAFIDQPTGHAF